MVDQFSNSLLLYMFSKVYILYKNHKLCSVELFINIIIIFNYIIDSTSRSNAWNRYLTQCKFRENKEDTCMKKTEGRDLKQSKYIALENSAVKNESSVRIMVNRN